MLTALTHTPSHRGNADGRGKFNLSTCATTKRSRLSALAVEFELFRVRPLPAASYCRFSDIQHQGRQTRRWLRGVNKCNQPENENGEAREHSGQLFHSSDQLLLHLRRVREEFKQDSPCKQRRFPHKHVPLFRYTRLVFSSTCIWFCFLWMPLWRTTFMLVEKSLVRPNKWQVSNPTLKESTPML